MPRKGLKAGTPRKWKLQEAARAQAKKAENELRPKLRKRLTELFAYLRDTRHMTAEDVAAAANVQRGAVVEWLGWSTNGHTIPRLPALELLAQHAGWSIDWLVAADDIPQLRSQRRRVGVLGEALREHVIGVLLRMIPDASHEAIASVLPPNETLLTAAEGLAFDYALPYAAAASGSPRRSWSRNYFAEALEEAADRLGLSEWERRSPWAFLRAQAGSDEERRGIDRLPGWEAVRMARERGFDLPPHGRAGTPD
jgi:hypothetical protein